MALIRSTTGSKLLVRHEHDNTSFPFATGDWDVPANCALSISSSRLAITLQAFAWRFIRHKNVASRSKSFVYVEYDANINGQLFAVAAHLNDYVAGTQDTAAFYANLHDTAASCKSGISEHVNGTETVIQETNPLSTAKPIGTGYKAALFCDGTTVRGRDYHAGNTYTGTLPTHSSGRVGAGVNGEADMAVFLRRFIVCTDRFTNVNGLPGAASTVEVRKADDTVLATATVTAGAAAVNMEFADLHLAKKIAVKNGGGTVIDSFTAATGEIIEPGETYTVYTGTGHRYWRVRDTVVTSGSVAAATEIEFQDATGRFPTHATYGYLESATLIPTPGGAVIKGDENTGFEAAGAFDRGWGWQGLTLTQWAADIPDAWIGYDFGEPVEIAEVLYRARDNGTRNQDPTTLLVEYSDDGTSWTTAQTHSGITGWSNQLAKVFTAGTIAEVQAGDLSRTTEGFLFSDDFNRADGAPGSNWSVLSGTVAIASNRLRASGGSANARSIAVSARHQMVVQGRAARNSGAAGGPTARHAAGGSKYYYQLEGTNNLVHAFRDEYNSLGTSTNNVSEPGELTFYKLHFSNGSQKSWWGMKAVTQNHTDTGNDGNNGTGGIHHNNTGNVEIEDYLEYTTNTVTVTGLPTGYKARVAGRLPVTESSGTATIDLDRVPCPVPYIEVQNGSGSVVSRKITSVYGGDTWAFSSSGTTVTPSTQSLLLTGYAPTLSHVLLLTPAQQSLLITGYVPTLGFGNITLTPGKQSLIITGFAPSPGAPVNLTVGRERLEIRGYPPIVQKAAAVLYLPTFGAVVLTQALRPRARTGDVRYSFSNKLRVSSGGTRKSWQCETKYYSLYDCGQIESELLTKQLFQVTGDAFGGTTLVHAADVSIKVEGTYLARVSFTLDAIDPS